MGNEVVLDVRRGVAPVCGACAGADALHRGASILSNAGRHLAHKPRLHLPFGPGRVGHGVSDRALPRSRAMSTMGRRRVHDPAVWCPMRPSQGRSDSPSRSVRCYGRREAFEWMHRLLQGAISEIEIRTGEACFRGY